MAHASRPYKSELAILLSATLLLRIIATSIPYYADGPRHIHAIDSGRLVIQPPGYFLFNSLGWATSRSLHIPAATALELINIAFSIAGVAVFYLAASRLLKSASSPFWLSLAYACSPIVWFAADIHSTYAAATFFAPLLLLVVEGESRFVLGCIVWAVMAGFRPSDGVFVLPWMLYQSLHFSWKQRLAGASAALIVIALWWVPTARRFGGGLLSPLSRSHTQVASLAQGVLTGHLTVHSLVTIAHASSGAILAWGLLIPFIALGLLLCSHNSLVRSMAIYLAPGMVFFFLYFFADAVYFAFVVAPGMLLVGAFLDDKRLALQRSIYATAIAASLLFMVAARPSEKPSKMRAVADAYLLQFSVHGLKQHKTLRLAELLGSCQDADVRGKCR